MADRNDLPSPGASNFGQRVRETLMTYLGRQGDPLDRGVTLRDLIEAGLIKVRDGMRLGLGSGIPPIEPVVDGGGGVGGTVDPYEPDLTPPPTPTGFAVLGAISHVFIEHDSPLYSQGHGHLRTRVYGKIVNTGDPLPTFSEAEELAQFTGTTYAHPSDPATTWRLWIKWETNDNVLSVTPAGGTNGLEAITGQDVSSLLEALSGSISEGQLATSLTDRIDLIDGPDTASGSVNARIKVVQDIASVKNRTYYSASEPAGSPGAPLVLGDLWFDTDAQNKLYRWTGSAWVAVDDARIASLVTDLSTEVTSRISGDLAETRKTEALYAASFAGTGNAYKVFVQESEPTGTQIGDIWSWVHPTTGAVTFKRFNGSTWVDSSSNKRPATYHGASSNAPTTSLVIGDLYYDIEDKKVYVYNGATWSQKLTTMPEVAAFVYSESVARVDGDGALAQTLSTISATKTRSYWQPTAPTGTVAVPLVEGDLWFDTDDNNQVYRWSGSAWQSGRDGTIAIVDARVTNVETAKIGYCTIGGVASDHTNKTDCQAAGGTWWVGLPLATAVKQVAISDGETTASLEQRFTAQKTTNNGLLAQYTVKVDVAGHVSGFGLASTLNNATPFSEFGIRADRFWIAPPATSSSTAPTTGLYKGYVWRDTGVTPAVTRYYTGSGWTTTPQVLPFVVQATPTTINGQEVPAGVYINGAYIQGGTIDGASIKGGSITGSKLIDVSANKITGAALLETAYIESYNYVSGTSGWKINGNGNAEFSGVVVRGTIYASAGTIGGINIGSTYIQSTNFVTGSAGWRLQSNGTAEFGAASIRGQLTASQIDTRGLSIKDASGNIILAAGSPLAVANVSGLGSLATLNSLGYDAITGTKPPSDATKGAPAGTLVGGTLAETIATATTNFNASNDRNSTAITAPTIATDGTAVDHSISTDGAADISFEWSWAGAEGDIDGFQVYVRQSTSSAAYTMGTTPAEETVYELPASKRAFVLFGTAADRYYTFGVRAYRSVDKDVNANGVIVSPLVQPTRTAAPSERPYLPSSTVSFAGDVSGTINSVAATTVTAGAANGSSAWGKFSGAGSTLPSGNVEFNFAGSSSKGGNATNTDSVGTQTAATVAGATVNFNSRNDRIATAVVAPVVANSAGTLDHVTNTDGSVDVSIEWTWSGTESDIDGFIVYVHDNGTATPTSQRVINGSANASESVYYVTPQRRAFILPGVAADHWYTIGVQAYRVVDPDINAAGVLRSTVAQPSSGATETTFGAYRPSSNVSFAGNITGTINGTVAAANVNQWSAISGAGKPADNATANVLYRQATDPGGANGDIWVDTSSTPNITRVKVSGSWQAAANYVTGASQIGAVATDLSNAPAGILNSSITLSTLGYTSRQGAGAPSSALGVPGDSYWDTASALLYYKTGVSTWTRVSPNITSANATTYIANGAIGSAQVGTLTAGNIDTTGLEIKDAKGNVILRSGNSPINAFSSFTSVRRADFANSTQDFVFGSLNYTLYPGYIRLTPTANYPNWLTPSGLKIDGRKYDKIQVRIRRVSGTGWQGVVYYNNITHNYSGSYYKQIADGTIIGEWVILEWDMAALTAGGTDWTSSPNIDAIRFDFANTPADVFEVDWISVGRYFGGGIDQVTPENASTFIADLAVNTLQIGENAVTFPAGSQRSTDTSDLTTSNQNVLDVSISSGGAPIYVVAKVLGQWLEGAGILLDLYINNTLEASESIGDVNSFWDNNASGKKTIMFHFYKASTSTSAFNVQIRARKTGTAQAYIKANSNIFVIATKK